MSHKAVSMALAAKAGKLIPTFRGKQWQELAQMLLDACTLVEGTDDLELEGAARIQITKYLAEVPFIPAVVGTALQERYRPIVYRGRIAISASDMQTYLMRATSQNVSVKSVAAMLAAARAVAFRLRGAGFKEQGRGPMGTIGRGIRSQRVRTPPPGRGRW
jgi:hypothetical protein